MTSSLVMPSLPPLPSAETLSRFSFLGKFISAGGFLDRVLTQISGNFQLEIKDVQTMYVDDDFSLSFSVEKVCHIEISHFS